MKARLTLVLVTQLFLLRQCVAQSFPGWEDPIQIWGVPSTHSIISSYSNGYGQHVLTAPVIGGSNDYFLIGNDGQPVYSSPGPFPVSTAGVSGAITGYLNVIYAVLVLSNGKIKVYYSSSGGDSWLSSIDYTPSGTPDVIDAFADFRGVHIVWNTVNEIYYVKYNPTSGDFDNPKHVTDMGAVTGVFPKVLTTGDRLIVSFVTTHLGDNDRGATRDADISGTPVWENDPRLAPSITRPAPPNPPDPVDFGNQSIAVRGNTLHMQVYETPTTPDPEEIFVTSRTISPPGDWSAPTPFPVSDHYGSGNDEAANFRRKMISCGDTAHSVYGRNLGGTSEVIARFVYTGTWTDPLDVPNPSSSVVFGHPTLSASRMGQFFYWSEGNNVKAWMRRRVWTLTGSITETVFLTGNNWVSDILNIESGVTITAKANSVTRILADKKIVVKSGAHLVMEAGSKFEFESGAQLVVEGKITADFTTGSNVLFTSSQTTKAPGDWLGIQLKGGPNTLKNCTVEYSRDGVLVNNTSTNLLDACTIRQTQYYGVVASNTSPTAGSTILQNCRIEENDAGLSVDHGRVDIVQTSPTPGIRYNDYGIVVYAGGKVYMDSTYITDNDSWGVVVDGSTAYASFSSNGVAKGKNRLRDNGASVSNTGQLLVEEGSAFLGNAYSYCDCYNPEDGPSHNGDPPKVMACAPGCTLVNVLLGGDNRISGNGLWVKNLTATTIPAELNYWGPPNHVCPPSSSYFDDPVDRANCKTGSGYRPIVVWKELEKDTPTSPSIDSVNVRSIIHHLKQVLLDNDGDVRDVLHWLSTFVGPGGMYERELGVSWESFLQTLSSLGSQRFKTLAKAYRVQAKMDKKNFNSAIALANTLLEGNPDDELWFHCQQSIVSALIAKEQFAEARGAFEAMASRGSSINPNATAHLLYILNLQNSSGISGGLKLPGLSSSTSNKSSNDVPAKTSLGQNFPNPYNPSTQIKYSLAADGPVTLIVYDLLGREVTVLENSVKRAGTYTASFDASKLSSGVYLYRLQSGSYTETRKMVVMK